MHGLSHDQGYGATRAGDGQSVMPIYNDVMTVTQMVDIAAFLESKYKGIERPAYRYRLYGD